MTSVVLDVAAVLTHAAVTGLVPNAFNSCIGEKNALRIVGLARRPPSLLQDEGSKAESIARS
jgi:hypothetical protein